MTLETKISSTAPLLQRRLHTNENRGFLIFHSAILAIVLIGFGRSYYLRDWFVERPLDVPLRIHGLFLTGWFAITAVQAYLIDSGRRSLHRQTAWLASAIALGVVLSATWINTRLALQIRSAQDPENAFVWVNYLSLLVFAVLFSTAVLKRREAQKHRRLMLLASIAIIGPAFARFAFWPVFGYGVAGGPPFAVGGLLLLMLALVGYDLLILRKVHPTTLRGIVAIVLFIAFGVGLGLSGMGFKVLNQLLMGAV